MLHHCDSVVCSQILCDCLLYCLCEVNTIQLYIVQCHVIHKYILCLSCLGRVKGSLMIVRCFYKFKVSSLGYIYIVTNNV
jgi:hypothetical protein